MSLWRKLEDVPREIVYGLLLIALIAPMIMPFGLPVPVGDEARLWYSTIEKLPAGSAVMIDSGYSGGAEAELGPMAVATYHHIFRRGGLKLVFISTVLEGADLWHRAIAEARPDQYGRKYGQDYVMLGYIAGWETAQAAIGKSIRATTPTDYQGTSLDQLPMMKGINEAKDFALVICFSNTGEPAEGWVRQWYTPYKVPYLASVFALMVPTMLPYRKAGQIVALLAGAQAGEYEHLIGKPGRGLKSADVMSTTHFLAMALIIIGNIAFWGRKMSERK